MWGEKYTRKKSESQMGFEPTTLRDLVGCSNHWATCFIFNMLTLEVGWLHFDMLQCDSVMLLVSFTCASQYLAV